MVLAGKSFSHPQEGSVQSSLNKTLLLLAGTDHTSIVVLARGVPQDQENRVEKVRQDMPVCHISGPPAPCCGRCLRSSVEPSPARYRLRHRRRWRHFALPTEEFEAEDWPVGEVRASSDKSAAPCITLYVLLPFDVVSSLEDAFATKAVRSFQGEAKRQDQVEEKFFL